MLIIGEGDKIQDLFRPQETFSIEQSWNPRSLIPIVCFRNIVGGTSFHLMAHFKSQKQFKSLNGKRVAFPY